VNIKKGINRIALVLAVIAVVPAFIFGWQTYRGKDIYLGVSSRTDDIRELQSEFELLALKHSLPKRPKSEPILPWDDVVEGEIYGELSQEGREKVKESYLNILILPRVSEEDIGLARKQFMDYAKQLDSTIIEYPPNWQCTIAGIVGSVFVFLLVFFGLRGLMHLGFWIVDGFRNEEVPIPKRKTRGRTQDSGFF